MEIKHAYLRTLAFQKYLHIFLIAAIGFIAYSNTFHDPFVLDDTKQIEKNLVIRDLDNFLLALKGHDFGPGAYEYIPSRFVGYLSFALNYHFGGAEVEGYHIVNLAIHILNGILVYFLVILTFRTPYFSPQRSALSDQRSAVGDDNSPHPPLKLRGGAEGGGVTFTIHDSRSFIALFSALLFVSHPLQTQAVTYIVQRFASLATFFYLLSLVMYIKGRLITQQSAISDQQSADDKQLRPRDHNSPFPPLIFSPQRIRLSAERGGGKAGGVNLFSFFCYFLSLLSAVLAMRTKEIAYTLPLVVVLYEWTFFTASLKKKLLFFLPVVLTLIIVLVSVMHSDKPLGEILSDISEKTRLKTEMGRWDYLMTEMRVITTYIRLLFVPINQNLDYDYPIYHSLFTPSVFLSFLFLSAIVGAAVYLLYKSRPGAMGYGQWEKAISDQQAASSDDNSPQPPLKLRGGAEGGGVTFAIHYFRLVAFGILWFFITLSVESSAIPIVDVIFEHRVYLPSVGFFMAITAGMFIAASRLKKGKSIVLILVLITLALSAVTYARNNVWKDGASLWEDVAKKSPNKARPHNYLGEIYSEQGRLAEAIKEYQAVLSLSSDYYYAHNNLGVAYYQLGRLDEAIREFQAVLSIRPDNAHVHSNLVAAYEQQVRQDKAHAHSNLGAAYEQQGRLDEAIKEYQAALMLNPYDADAHYNLGLVYERRGRPDEAIREYQAALRLNPDDADAHKKLEAFNKQ